MTSMTIYPSEQEYDRMCLAVIQADELHTKLRAEVERLRESLTAARGGDPTRCPACYASPGQHYGWCKLGAANALLDRVTGCVSDKLLAEIAAHLAGQPATAPDPKAVSGAGAGPAPDAASQPGAPVSLGEAERAAADQRVLDAMAAVPEHWLRLDVGGDDYAEVRAAELARRGLK